MRRVSILMLTILWLMGCQKKVDMPVDICPISKTDSAAYLFIKSVSDTSTQRVLTNTIYQNEIVGTWEFKHCRFVQVKQRCYTYLNGGAQQIVLTFKPDSTFTYTTTEQIGNTAAYGKGKLESSFGSSYPNSNLQLYIRAPKGNKMFVGIDSRDYLDSYFQKR